MELKAIFWDNDGVLVDTERLYFESNAKVLEPFGIELSREQYRQHWLVNSRGLIAIGRDAGLSDELIEQLRKRRDAIYMQLISEKEIVIPGVRQAIETLPKGVRSAIVTSSKPEHFEVIHRRTGLLSLFEFAITPADYNHSKPDPEPYLLALSRTGLLPEECIVIEDSERGLAAALGAGIRCWIIPSELNAGADFAGADRIISRIADVPQLIRRLFPSFGSSPELT
jgi:HAD superfamily hydrolase (TIGR01509 family)